MLDMNEPKLISKWYFALAGLGVGLRLVFLLAAGELDPHADESNYIYLALCWNRFGFLSDCVNYLWPPGYPFFLAVCLDRFGIDGIFASKLCQVIAAGIVGYFTMLIAGHSFGRRAGLVAGLIWCLYLPLIAFTHYNWPETLFLAFFLPAFYLLLTWHAGPLRVRVGTGRLLVAGLLYGVSLLLKEVGLYLAGVFVLLIIWRHRRVSWIAGLRSASLFAGAVAVVILPWSMRNYEVYGRVVPVAATLGENCQKGVVQNYHNSDYRRLLEVEPDAPAAASAPIGGDERVKSPAPVLRFGVPDYDPDSIVYRWFIQRPQETEWSRSEARNIIDRSRENAQLAVDFAREFPGYFARGRVKRLADWLTPTSFFVRHFGLQLYDGLLDRPALRRMLIVVALLESMLVLAGAAAAVALCLPRSPAAAIIGWTLLYALGPALLVGTSRYRVSFEPILIVLAAAFIAGCHRPWTSRKPALMAWMLGWVALAAAWTLSGGAVSEFIEAIW